MARRDGCWSKAACRSTSASSRRRNECSIRRRCCSRAATSCSGRAGGITPWYASFVRRRSRLEGGFDDTQRAPDLVARIVEVRREADRPFAERVTHTRCLQRSTDIGRVGHPQRDNAGAVARRRRRHELDVALTRCPEHDHVSERRDVKRDRGRPELVNQLEARVHSGKVLERKGDELEPTRVLAPGAPTRTRSRKSSPRGTSASSKALASPRDDARCSIKPSRPWC